MELPSYFADFLQDVRLSQEQVDDCKTGHRTLRRRLEEDPRLSPLIISTFLQGSYRRATAVRPYGGKRADVDVMTVTRLSEQEYTPDEALELFVPFLEKHYKGKYKRQGRSFGIELSYVDLDLVISSAPSEREGELLRAASVITDNTLEDVDDWRLVKSWIPLEERSVWNADSLLTSARKQEEWKLLPLRIPNREAARWESTHPLAQIQWTRDKNKRCNGHYVSVVKAVKWWRRVRHSTQEYPKGYPVEHVVGVCCPDGIRTVAEGVTRTLEIIVCDFAQEASREQTPFLPDHGVPEHNVLGRVSGKDFAAFYRQVRSAATTARGAFDAQDLRESVEGWQELFGPSFPDAPPQSEGDDRANKGAVVGGYSSRSDKSEIGGGRFA
jgi:hypothetical protein